jgi:hypothetical protein
MIVTWERFCKRRGLTLGDLVQGHGLDYDKLCAFFDARGSTFPSRHDPVVVALFGYPEPEKPTKDPESTPPPHEIVSNTSPRDSRKLEVSIKNTKAELLAMAVGLRLDVNNKLTKTKILEVLAGSSKVVVNEVQTSRRKKPRSKKK